jgi:hypothetical protein
MNCENCQRIRELEGQVRSLKGALEFYCLAFNHRAKGWWEVIKSILPVTIEGGN